LTLFRRLTLETDRALRCDCGFIARADDEDGLLTQIQRHAVEAHGMALSRDDALMLAFHAQLNENPAITPKSGTRTEGEER
jgi:Protein of unknown function (DUF1059)